MRAFILGAACAAIAIVFLASSAVADVVDLTDGKDNIRRPKTETVWGEVPSDAELRETRNQKLDLAYDRASIGRQAFNPAQIVDVYITTAYMNEAFNNGEKYGVSGYWREAAEAFRQAASELEGSAKQWALYKRLLATANTNNNRATMKAANDLIAAAEKGYWYGPAQEIRARLWAIGKKPKEAQKALQLVIDAKGMNARDYFSAKYLKTWLSKSIGADSAAKWHAAETAYRTLLTEIQGHPNRALAQVPKFRALMSLGEALRSQGKTEESRKIFKDILRDANESTDKGVLAGVYYGLGDLVFDDATKLQASGTTSQTTKEQVRALLDQSALHYLRVILLYGDFANQREIFGATRGAARVMKAIFSLSDEKDCAMGKDAYEYYRQAVNMMDAGEERRLLIAEGLALKARLKEKCQTPKEPSKAAPAK